MATPVTEHDYPPIDSQGIHTFITDQGGATTGDLQTDFRLALFLAVAPGGKVNDYSIDDLWQRHVIANVATDGNAEAGNPAAAGRGKAGFVGNRPLMYYVAAFMRNAGNANKFPGSATAFDITAYSKIGGGTAIVGIADPRNPIWNADGTKILMYNDAAGYALGEATCSTAYDPSSVGSFSEGTGSGTERIREFIWNGDGSQGHGFEPGFTTFHPFTPSAAYGNTGTWNATIAGTIHEGDCFCWNGDGTQIFTYSEQDDLMYAFPLATPYVFTATDIDIGDETESINLDTILGTGTSISSMQFDATGMHIIVYDGAVATKAFRQIDLLSAYTLTGAVDSELSLATPSTGSYRPAFYNDDNDIMIHDAGQLWHYQR